MELASYGMSRRMFCNTDEYSKVFSSGHVGSASMLKYRIDFLVDALCDIFWNTDRVKKLEILPLTTIEI